MTGTWIWLTAACMYALFRGWYDNWRGPLTPAEVEAFMEKAKALGSDSNNDLAIFHKFLEQDDGREFIMLNLVRIAPGLIPDPETGKPTSGMELLNRYTRPFMRRLIARGGHPTIVARKVGGYFDAWRVEADPGWSVMGYMRYRSRRDVATLAIDPFFVGIHKFKLAGTAETFSFPTQPILTLHVSPRIWLGLLIALIAALTHLHLLSG